MFVTVEFEKNGTEYRIERGRKPNVFRFYANNQETAIEDNDEAQGENRLTQEEIEKVLGLGHEMFKHLIALNTNTEPFLSMKAGDQRNIIEQLLGITKLSEKADALKELIRGTKDRITQEEFRINAIKESNKKIEENIQSLERRKMLWDREHNGAVEDLTAELVDLEKLDIDAEINSHNQNQENLRKQQDIASLEKELRRLDAHLISLNRQFSTLATSFETSASKSCPQCGQDIDGHKHEEIVADIEKQIQTISEEIVAEEEQRAEIAAALKQIDAAPLIKTFYKSVSDAYDHKSRIATTMSKLEREIAMTNPYIENIDNLKSSGLQEISYELMNTLIKQREHEEFLLKLLTNKDSFIRKKIIRQNLTYLNKRLGFYLTKVGLPHLVEFQPDLSVMITEHGRELDFDNLSRGEKTRLILSLSWAFRDVFESLNDKFNLLYVDELMDNGLDASGVEACLSLLKKMSREDKRCVHLISHREELTNRVDNVIKVVKENGFTSIESDI